MGGSNILYVNHFSEMSGAEVVLTSLIENLDKAQFTPIVACPGPGSLVNRLRQMGIEVRIVRMPFLRKTCNPILLFSYLVHFFYVSLQLVKLIIQRDVALVHANSLSACLYSNIAAKLCGIPIVWHMHDILRDSLINRIIVRLAGTGATKVIAISNAVRESLVKFGVDPKKCMVIYNGIRLNNRSQTDASDKDLVRDEFNIPYDAPLVGIIGRLHPLKGQETFLRAASKVVTRFPDAKFLIVGDIMGYGSEDYKIRLGTLTRELKLSRSVVFTGFRRDVRRILAALDILVSASWVEPFGLVIIEAMAMAKPVIGTTAGAGPELIEHGITGLLVPPKDADALEEAICSLLENRRIAECMGLNGQRIVRQKFDLRNNLDKITNLYRTLLREDQKSVRSKANEKPGLGKE